MRSFESMGFLKSWLKNNQLIILNKEASDFRGFCFRTLFASRTPHVENNATINTHNRSRRCRVNGSPQVIGSRPSGNGAGSQ